jgi:hypothetical protein
VIAGMAPARAAEVAVPADPLAGLLAGRGLPPFSGLPEPVLHTSTYAAYARRLNQAWARYDVRTRQPVAAWVERELDVIPDLVFYPFSGPDILNALAFFPRGKRFLLVGLERIGELPDAESLTPRKLRTGLVQIEAALGEILGYNFFRTRDMSVEVGAHPLSGTAGLLLLFLARTGHTITGARRVAIDADGQIVEPPEGSGQAAPGLELRFRAPSDTTDRIVYYFQRDLSNRAWQHGQPDIERLLRHEARSTTFLKAASYLMFKRRFSRIRALVLDKSERVVQDASGIPFKYLQQAPWSLRLYGRYEQANHLFSPFDQPRLRAAMRASSLGRLPFSFGYDYHRGTSHVIVGVRQAEARAETDEGRARVVR